jgi:hypothetical protein
LKLRAAFVNSGFSSSLHNTSAIVVLAGGFMNWISYGACEKQFALQNLFE